MEIKISIEKKYVWLLILALTATSLVIAYNTNPPNPPVMGHSIGEVEGVDQKVIDVMNAQAATYLSGKSIIEGRYVSLGSQTTWQYNGGPTSLEQFTTVYGRVGQTMEQRACHSAMNAYCSTLGY